MRLARRDDEYVISVNGKTLMSSRMLGSEVALAMVACRHVRTMKQAARTRGRAGLHAASDTRFVSPYAKKLEGGREAIFRLANRLGPAFRVTRLKSL
jgi:hypothetical protein